MRAEARLIPALPEATGPVATVAFPWAHRQRASLRTRLRAFARAALLVGIAACDTPSVDAPGPAYDPTALTSGRVYHWPVGARISVYIEPGPASAGDMLEMQTRTAVARWSKVLAYREHELRVVSDPGAADIVVRDARTTAPVDTSCMAMVWTHARTNTFFCPSGDSVRTLQRREGLSGRAKVLVTIDVEQTADTELDVLPLVVHELGHALGIGGHSSVQADVMFAVPSTTTPTARDARTLRYLIHQPADLTL